MPREKKEYYIALVSISPYYEKILTKKKYGFSEFVDAGKELLQQEEYQKYDTFRVYHKDELPE